METKTKKIVVPVAVVLVVLAVVMPVSTETVEAAPVTNVTSTNPALTTGGTAEVLAMTRASFDTALFVGPVILADYGCRYSWWGWSGYAKCRYGRYSIRMSRYSVTVTRIGGARWYYPRSSNSVHAQRALARMMIRNWFTGKG